MFKLELVDNCLYGMHNLLHVHGEYGRGARMTSPSFRVYAFGH